MPETRSCSRCGAALLPDVPGGHCLRCLLQLGLVPGLAAASAEPGTAPAAPTLGDAPPVERTGERIGRYKLLEKIGEGGCGVVYMAEQESPVRRRVALKVIKVGLDTKHVIARFEAERQALAMMDHPNIAKVLDGGATESGRPYFVMELVRGSENHRLLRRTKALHAPAAGFVHPGLPRHPARPPERNHPSGHQAVERSRDAQRRRSRAENH